MQHDQLFKSLLTTFFFEFLDLFFPDVARQLNPESIEFLDKEIFTDISSGERHEVDLLVKAKFQNKDAFFLIHVENQATAQEAFGQRMFRYFARLHEKHQLPVYPIVLFSYNSPQTLAPRQYEVAVANFRILDFRYRVIQLNRLNWRSFVKRPNPVASALMVKMKIAPPDRPRVKLECLRMIVRLKLDRARSALIGAFMHNYLKLSAPEEVVYNASMATIAPKEQDDVVEITNEWRLDASRQMIVAMLEHRFGKVSAALRNRIAKLREEQLREMNIAAYDFRQIQDANNWITARKTASRIRRSGR